MCNKGTISRVISCSHILFQHSILMHVNKYRQLSYFIGFFVISILIISLSSTESIMVYINQMKNLLFLAGWVNKLGLSIRFNNSQRIRGNWQNFNSYLHTLLSVRANFHFCKKISGTDDAIVVIKDHSFTMFILVSLL